MKKNHFLKGRAAALFLLLLCASVVHANEPAPEPAPNKPVKRSALQRFRTRFWWVSIRAWRHIDSKTAGIGLLSGTLLAVGLWHKRIFDRLAEERKKKS